MTGPSLPQLEDRHRRLLDETLHDLLSREAQEWRTVHPALGDAVAALAGVVGSGGKRLRPLLCYLSFVGTTASGDAIDHDAADDDADDAVLPACAALELVHTFAIVQDDIIDGSPRRRGGPALHVALADAHRRHGWRGDADRFGIGAGSLVADLAFVLADHLMQGYPAPARHLFDRLRIEVVMGEVLDVSSAREAVPDAGLSRLVCRYKTAKYTVERPMQLGCLLGGTPEERLAAVSRFAVPLGTAFQLRDDVLGAFGDSDVTGKPVGDDLREGKPTLLLTYAAAAAGPTGREVLGRCGDGALDDDEVARIQDVIVSSGALKRVQREIDDLFAEARAALDALPLAPWARDAVGALARAMAYRDS